MLTGVRTVAIACISLCCIADLCRADKEATNSHAADNPSPAEQIRGQWVLYRETPNGKYMTIKEHTGDRTVVTTYDANKKPVESHRSEFRVETSGGIPVFRYKNKVVLVGPHAGAKDERESAYIFRVEGDLFYELHGMLPGDRGKPSLIIWERLKDNPIPQPQA